MLVDPTPIVTQHVKAVSDKRRAAIERLTLHKLLSTKNPYLFIARQVDTPAEFAEELVAAALSSSEETMFGNTLEAIAIDVCAAAYGGQKSAATGIDLEFSRDSRRYLVSIKSGPNWGNSSQIKRLRQDLSTAAKLVRQHDPTTNVMPVNGCCYGTGDSDFGDYRKVCGAAFWEFISGDPDLYSRLVDPLRDAASNGFITERTNLVRHLSVELAGSWCTPEGQLDWPRIVGLSVNLQPQLGDVP